MRRVTIRPDSWNSLLEIFLPVCGASTDLASCLHRTRMCRRGAVVPEGHLDQTHTQVRTDLVAELAAEGLEDPQLVGQGGFGVIYRCRQPGLDRIVAVKILNASNDEGERSRFVQEQLAMGRLSGHPNIIQVLQAGVTLAGRPIIVM